MCSSWPLFSPCNPLLRIASVTRVKGGLSAALQMWHSASSALPFQLARLEVQLHERPPPPAVGFLDCLPGSMGEQTLLGIASLFLVS